MSVRLADTVIFYVTQYIAKKPYTLILFNISPIASFDFTR